MYGECEYLKECKVKITVDFFDRICTSRNHDKCYHRANKLDQLLEPWQWTTSINEVGGPCRLLTKVSRIFRKIEGDEGAE